MYRNLFAEFVEWSHALRPDLVDDETVSLAGQTAGQWNALADAMLTVREDAHSAGLWNSASESVRAIHAIEAALFENLGDRVLI